MTKEEHNMVNDAINYLLNIKLITEEETKTLKEFYNNDNRPFDIVKAEIIKLSNNEQLRKEFIASLQNQKIDKITNITDFKKDDKNYLKIDYSNNNVRIIENNMNESGKETYQYIEQTHGNNATKIFEQLLKDANEIKLYDFRNLENKNVYENLTNEQKQNVYLVMTNEKYKDKIVICSPETSIYIVKEENGKDTLLEVNNKEGIYQIIQITNNTNEEIDSSNTKGKQKRLGSNPVSKLKWYNEEAGFMNTLFFIFLTGFTSGIIIMLIMNFILK